MPHLLGQLGSPLPSKVACNDLKPKLPLTTLRGGRETNETKKLGFVESVPTNYGAHYICGGDMKTKERSSHASNIYGVLAMNEFQRLFFSCRVVSLLVFGVL